MFGGFLFGEALYGQLELLVAASPVSGFASGYAVAGAVATIGDVGFAVAEPETVPAVAAEGDDERRFG